MRSGDPNGEPAYTLRAMPGAGRMATFFVVLIAASTALHFLIDIGLKRIESDAFGVFNNIVTGRINAAILITGSSRALTHYDPRIITTHTGESAWNIGMNGSQTDMQRAVLKTYLAHNSAPKLLIHNLDSFAFKTSKEGIVDPELYVPYLNEEPLYDALLSLDRDWRKVKYLPLYGYAVQDMNFSWVRGLGALIGIHPREHRFRGFEPREREWNEDFARFRQSRPNGVQFEIDPDGLRDFEELVASAHALGVRVLLVYSPVYFEMTRLEQGRDEMFARFRHIAEKYDATLWDYSDSDISQRQDLFYNSQHLNSRGAALFSEDLARRLAAADFLERATHSDVSDTQRATVTRASTASQ